MTDDNPVRMELYGRPLDDDDEPWVLREVALVADPATLRSLAEFLKQAADRLEEGGFEFDHAHYQDFARIELDQGEFWGGDVIVAEPDADYSRGDRGDPLSREADCAGEGGVAPRRRAGRGAAGSRA